MNYLAAELTRYAFGQVLLRINDTVLQLENGEEVTYQIMEKVDTALIVPIDENDNLIS